ncbi:MAG: TlpA family protein disulfide reductase [Flavobacteriaceae bacterium]|nr:TlpA family protein disulfide reductase [Flavobacteriaceae bacterium]
MKNIRTVLILLIVFPFSLLAQYKIKATFSPAENYKWAILYKNTPTSNIYGGQGKIEDGKIMFNLGEKAPPGIYSLVYAIPQYEFNFDVIYDGKEDIELTFNVEKGLEFQTSEVNKMLSNYQHEMNLIKTQIGEFYAKKKTSSSELMAFFNSQKEIQDFYEKESKGTLAYEFIVADRPYIPSTFEKDPDYKNHISNSFFTNIDFNNTVLQSSRFLIDRTISYILGSKEKGLSKNDTYNRNIDEIYNHLKNSEVNFRKLFLVDLWDKLVLYQFNDNANYLAEKYLIPFATEQKDQQLVNKLVQFKNLSIGNTAPDFTWETTENGTTKTNKLSELSIAENYILVFWSSTCSHCLKEIPKLNQFVQSLDSFKYKVIAVGLEEEPVNWQTEIAKYPDFIHVIKLKKWDSQIAQDYGLTSTPTYFVLDKDKKFIEKPESFEELIELISIKK